MNERLKFFIQYLKDNRIVLSDSEFARITSKQKSVLSEIISGKRTVSKQYVRIIADNFSQLNEVWLLTGEGEMLKDDQEKPSVEISHLQELIKTQAETINSQKLLIEALYEKIERLQRAVEERG